ncbi:penicillin-binding protein [Longibacter salinarum]|uniref:Penicillin-binding protein n=2 Tax=Longibacter salinarum TaxID=1850348 RepID=A0A2A8CXB4_9BACT|nr:penicillin-binding protein [Longibacter salinarum]
MYMVLTLLSVVPLFVLAQMGWIVLTEGSELKARGQNQARSTVEIPAMRGSILDRSGRALAINTARYDVALDPTIDGFEQKSAMFYRKFADLTGMSESRLRTTVAERYSPQYVMLYRGLDEMQRETVEEWDVPGLILSPRFARRYNYGTTAAHVLGHIDTDGTGRSGVELQYDDFLTGEPGWHAVKRDRRGRIKAFVGGTVVKPKHGQNVVLTIDLVRQAALEDELARGVKESGAKWGTAIAMDPNTGAILAMANVPTYDPNHPGRATSARRRNRSITDQFEPGSTFKLVGAAAAVEQDIVSLEDSVETGEGWAVFHGYTMKDVKAYGTISFAEVLSKSSNVGMAKTATRIDEGIFYQYARNLGFGQPTWIDLPGEVGGTLKKPANWSRTSLTSMSIGYEVSVTPIQLLAAYSALANGGLLVQPHVVKERRSVTGERLWTQRPDSIRRALKPSTTDALRPAFEKTVETGTATAAQVSGLEIAGKTGTALKVSGGKYSGDQARASFVGFFPADDPKIALLVIVGEPETSMYGGAVAAPIFQNIARRWVGTFPEVVDHIVAESDTASADVERMTAPSQTSPPTVQARLADASGDTMPDLRGLTTRDAVHWLQKHGVDVRLFGQGLVQKQSPQPGEPLPSTAMVTGE